jgi:hypothetical protein
METEGLFAPETAAAARERYEALGPTAQTVVKQVAKAMELSPEEYDERVTSEVVETAREVLFASTLEVHVGDREAFEDWLEGRDREVVEFGNENVDGVVWHDAAFADTVVAATFHEQRRAAVETLRRQAFGRVYREVV